MSRVSNSPIESVIAVRLQQIAEDIQRVIDHADMHGSANPEYIAGLETAQALILGDLDARPAELKVADSE